MSIIVNTLQEVKRVPMVTFKDLLAVLPETLAVKADVWVSGPMARYGKTAEKLLFLLREDSVEVKDFLNFLISPLGLGAQFSMGWRQAGISAVRLYAKGELVWDRDVVAYKLPLIPVESPIHMTVQEVLAALPDTVPFEETIYLTGGMVRQGFSCQDVDFLVLDTRVVGQKLADMRDYFKQYLWLSVDVGNRVMPDREPVYLYKIYEQNKQTFK